ncbi:MAG: hypothetical protein ACJ8BE_22125 [Microvirga sp.]
MLAEAHLTAVVYDPPTSGLPHIAVLFDAEGDVIAVRTAASIDEGEAALANLIADLSAAQHATAQVRAAAAGGPIAAASGGGAVRPEKADEAAD